MSSDPFGLKYDECNFIIWSSQVSGRGYNNWFCQLCAEMAILRPLLWPTAAPVVPKAPAPARALTASRACSWRVKMSVRAQSNQTQTLVGNVSHTSCEPKARTHLVVARTHTLVHTIVNESQKRMPIHRGPRRFTSTHMCTDQTMSAQERSTPQTPAWRCRAGPRFALTVRRV